MSPSNKRIAYALEGAPRTFIALAGLMEEMVRVFSLENEVVSTRRLKEHPDLLKHKQKLAMDYRASMKTIAADPALAKQLTPDAKEALKEMAQKLTEASAKNALILRAAVVATQQLIQNVVSMVKAEVLPTKSYKNPATAHLALGNYSPTCRPVAVSRSV
jgi:hypothetical protein